MNEKSNFGYTETNGDNGVYFSVPGQPQGKARARIMRIGKFTRAYTPKQTVDYENQIKAAYNEKYGASVYFQEMPIELKVIAIYDVPSSYSQIKTRHALAGEILPLVKPDADNILKVVCDALNKVAYQDDKQIYRLHIEKMYGTEPRLDIFITGGKKL